MVRKKSNFKLGVVGLSVVRPTYVTGFENLTNTVKYCLGLQRKASEKNKKHCRSDEGIMS